MPDIADRLRGLDLGISSVTLAELEYGVARSSHPQKNGTALRHFCTGIIVYPFDTLAASIYGKIRSELETAGTLFGPLDTLIAAHALALNSMLVTNNIKDFQRVRGLRIQPGNFDIR
jgi:tRNA(fMet)-specific endonuclease VapC